MRTVTCVQWACAVCARACIRGLVVVEAQGWQCEPRLYGRNKAATPLPGRRPSVAVACRRTPSIGVSGFVPVWWERCESFGVLLVAMHGASAATAMGFVHKGVSSGLAMMVMVVN